MSNKWCLIMVVDLHLETESLFLQPERNIIILCICRGLFVSEKMRDGDSSKRIIWPNAVDIDG